MICRRALLFSPSQTQCRFAFVDVLVAHATLWIIAIEHHFYMRIRQRLIVENSKARIAKERIQFSSGLYLGDAYSSIEWQRRWSNQRTHLAIFVSRVCRRTRTSAHRASNKEAHEVAVC